MTSLSPGFGNEMGHTNDLYVLPGRDSLSMGASAHLGHQTPSLRMVQVGLLPRVQRLSCGRPPGVLVGCCNSGQL